MCPAEQLRDEGAAVVLPWRGISIPVQDMILTSALSFHFVGVELGLPEPAASRGSLPAPLIHATAHRHLLHLVAHCRPPPSPLRLPDLQLPPGRRRPPLHCQQVPVPQGPAAAQPLAMPGCCHGTLSLGASAVREPIAEASLLQPHWLQPIANSPGLVGCLHHAVACLAAVWPPDTEDPSVVTVPSPCSSTHCVLVVLSSALRHNPSEVSSDSLCSLQLLRCWGSRSTAAVLPMC